jgi:hypothetical protein
MIYPYGPRPVLSTRTIAICGISALIVGMAYGHFIAATNLPTNGYTSEPSRIKPPVWAGNLEASEGAPISRPRERGAPMTSASYVNRPNAESAASATHKTRLLDNRASQPIVNGSRIALPPRRPQEIETKTETLAANNPQVASPNDGSGQKPKSSGLLGLPHIAENLPSVGGIFKPIGDGFSTLMRKIY